MVCSSRGAGPIRLRGRSRYAHDCSAAATASIRRRFGLQLHPQRLQVMVVTAPIIAPMLQRWSSLVDEITYEVCCLA